MSKIRPILGDSVSLSCMKSIISGMEETFGHKATSLVLGSVARKHGHQLAKSLTFLQSDPIDLLELKNQLNKTLGEEGTQLVLIQQIDLLPNGGFQVMAAETVCSAGEMQGSVRECVFTMGIIQGILEGIYNKTLCAYQTESVLRGAAFDVLTFTPCQQRKECITPYIPTTKG